MTKKESGGDFMSKLLRLKCPCGNVVNAYPGEVCPKCKQPIPIPRDGTIYLYRMGSPLGIAGGFGLYLNGEPMGHIGNKETIRIPVKFGSYNLHVASGMNRRCNDMVINITPQSPFAFLKVRMKMGFFTNSFVLEPSNPQEMPDL